MSPDDPSRLDSVTLPGPPPERDRMHAWERHTYTSHVLSSVPGTLHPCMPRWCRQVVSQDAAADAPRRARVCAVTCCPCSLSPCSLPSCCRVATQRPGVSLYLCLPSPLTVHPSFHHPFIRFFPHHTPCHSTFPLHHSPKHAGPPHRRRAVKENPHSEAPQSVSCCRSDAHTHTTRPHAQHAPTRLLHRSPPTPANAHIAVQPAAASR